MKRTDPHSVALQIARQGTPDQIEETIHVYKENDALGRSTWNILQYSEWLDLCSIWRRTLEADLNLLKTTVFDAQKIGRLQGRIEILELMLRTRDYLKNEGKKIVTGIRVLREGLERAQNRAAMGGDPDIQSLREADKKDREARSAGIHNENGV